MKLTAKAITAISNRGSMLALALALGFTEVWIVKLIEANKENGPLTTAKALQVIKSESGLNESEILESEPVGEVSDKKGN